MAARRGNLFEVSPPTSLVTRLSNFLSAQFNLLSALCIALAEIVDSFHAST